MKGVWNLSTDSCMRCGCVDHFVCGLWTLSGLSGHWRRSTVQLPAQRGSCRGAAVRGRYRTVLIQPACEPPLKYPLIQRSSASLSRALVRGLPLHKDYHPYLLSKTAAYRESVTPYETGRMRSYFWYGISPASYNCSRVPLNFRGKLRACPVVGCRCPFSQITFNFHNNKK